MRSETTPLSSFIFTLITLIPHKLNHKRAAKIFIVSLEDGSSSISLFTWRFHFLFDINLLDGALFMVYFVCGYTGPRWSYFEINLLDGAVQNKKLLHYSHKYIFTNKYFFSKKIKNNCYTQHSVSMKHFLWPLSHQNIWKWIYWYECTGHTRKVANSEPAVSNEYFGLERFTKNIPVSAKGKGIWLNVREMGQVWQTQEKGTLSRFWFRFETKVKETQFQLKH